MPAHRPVRAVLAAVLLGGAALTATQLTRSDPAGAAAAAPARILRVYSNNIENLVMNGKNGACTRVSAREHLASILADRAAPDLLVLQQLRGKGQATAYADQVSARFGYPRGTYRAIVAWDDPEEWGGSHKCATKSLGNLKKKQTNGIVYNTRTLALGEVSRYWSAGWLKPGRSYAGGNGCTLYKPPTADPDRTDRAKWKRTSAIAARFTIRGTSTRVFAATMHLPQENRKNACAGAKDKGLGGSGIRIGADATRLMNGSSIRVVGIDANRKGIPAGVLGGSGLRGYGTTATHSDDKIDYLFVRGSVRPSAIGHTVAGTKSNHRALYAFLSY